MATAAQADAPSRPLRISVMCGGSRVFGMERIALAIIRGLHERGHTIRCLVSSWGDGDFPSRLEAIGVDYDRVPLGKVSLTPKLPYAWWTMKALALLPAARRRCRQHLASFKPQVVIFYDRDWMVMNGRSVEEHPTLFHVHGLPSERLPSESRLNAWRLRRLDRRTSRYVVISRSMRDALLRLGVPASKTALVYNGVEPAEPPRRAPIGTDSPVIGVVGQVAPWKGHEDLLDALGILKKTEVPFQCIIFGTGERSYTDHLAEKIERLGLGGSVRWAGYVPATDDIFRQIDVCAMPSRIDESFGLVAAEAGLRGIPVIATRRGALPEVVKHAETGFLVPSECPSELAERLHELLSSSDLRRRFGAAAREHVLGCFTEARMVQQMETLCLQLAN